MPLHYERNGSVAIITLDHPPVNAFTPDLHRRLFEILQDFVADRTVRVGVWTAVGDRAFCAGDDIKSKRPERSLAEIIELHMTPSRDDVDPEYPGWEKEVLQLVRYKPIIAAVNGPCLGQGLIYLTLLTDLRLATPSSYFGFPEIAMGMGGAGGMTRLGQQIPHAIAMWMLLTGQPLTAAQALQHGLINEIVETAELLPRALEYAELVCRHPALGVRTEMEAYYRGQDLSRVDAINYSSNLFRLQRAAQWPVKS